MRFCFTSLAKWARRPGWVSSLPVLLAPLGVAAATGEAPVFPPEQIEYFEKEIRPLLATRCLECHTGTKAMVGLQLNHRAGWLKGSDYRTVVNLENPGESLLVHALRHTGEQKVKDMPAEGPKLDDGEIGKIQDWIAMGLPWPAERETEGIDPRQHWSFQPVRPPALEGGHPVDRLLAVAREKAGIQPAPAADRPTLFRRVHLDLLGLPPDYQELQQFVQDPRPDPVVWEEWLDRLMDSPHYGERWARHWMDIARYSDTRGYEVGAIERRFVYSYTYRDWLIRAFNEDMPYDQFLLYQLAAEQLVDWESPDKRHLAAMGFLSLSKKDSQELILDDRLDTTFRGLMALTVSCARCHDHKFDPISTKDYYGLYGVFGNSMVEDTPVIAEPAVTPEYEAYLAGLAEKQKAVDDYLEPKLEGLAKEFPDLADDRTKLMGKLSPPDRKELRSKEDAVRKYIADQEMGPDKALILKDREAPAPQHVLIRGTPGRHGELAPRQFPAIFNQGEPVAFTQGSGRLEMAREIVKPSNPLTARNLVNRVWMWHFGQGLVRSVDDFGLTGEAPDHPELLDWLAHWFVEEGWSFKKLHKLILTSETWRQSADHPSAGQNLQIDPENRLLWRFPRRRLDLEQMRDGMLAVAGNLDRTLHGRAVKIFEPPYSDRRTVYAFIDRQNLNPVFRNFDFSNPAETTAQRPGTTIPMQALFTLNNAFVEQQAHTLAEKAAQENDPVQALHRRVYAREPSDRDRELAATFLQTFAEGIRDHADRQTATVWSYGWGGVDEDTGQLHFQTLPHWTGSRWQPREEYPVANNPLSYLNVSPGAVHPGSTDRESAIIQWRAPADLEIRVESEARRDAVDKGNGVRLLVVSSRTGILHDEILPAENQTLKIRLDKITVQEGEILSFVVDPRERNASYDSVSWDPKIVDLSGEWNSWVMSVDFSGPTRTATALSAYAQALLNTNRFLFLD